MIRREHLTGRGKDLAERQTSRIAYQDVACRAETGSRSKARAIQPVTAVRKESPNRSKNDGWGDG